MATDVSNTGITTEHGHRVARRQLHIGQSASAAVHSISVPDFVCSQYSRGGVLWSCVTVD
jgi:hypothetical protein